MKQSQECGPLKLRPRDDRELGKHKDMLLCSLTTARTFADFLVHLHLYTHTYKYSLWNTEYCVWSLPLTRSGKACQAYKCPPDPFDGCTMNPASHLPLAENMENWFLSFTVISAQRLCGQEICLPCQWFRGAINNAGWFSNKQPFLRGFKGTLCLSFF